MNGSRRVEPSDLRDLHWSADGYAAIGGELLAWCKLLDAEICRWAGEEGAEDQRFPSLISLASLQPIAYLKSFPHLATFATCAVGDEENLRQVAATGSASVEQLQQPRQLLTPAACYHFYHRLARERLHEPRFLTTRCTCHRREEQYSALRRQWCFEMREIVCIGTADDVNEFVIRAETRIAELIDRLDIAATWAVATDPFFDPMADPKALSQMLEPVKRELCLNDGLAISSINRHRSFFGECYDITIGGAAAQSSCVAFGLERWLFAMQSQHGSTVADWPLPGAGH